MNNSAKSVAPRLAITRLMDDWREEADRFDASAAGLLSNRAGTAVAHEKQRIAAAYRRCANELDAALRACAEKCQFCNGAGISTYVNNESASGFTEHTCPVCHGSGRACAEALAPSPDTDDLLDRFEEYLDNHNDVIDGDGGPIANTAMSLLDDLQRWRKKRP